MSGQKQFVQHQDGRNRETKDHLIQKKEEELRLTTGKMIVSKSGGLEILAKMLNKKQLCQARQTIIEEMGSFALKKKKARYHWFKKRERLAARSSPNRKTHPQFLQDFYPVGDLMCGSFLLCVTGQLQKSPSGHAPYLAWTYADSIWKASLGLSYGGGWETKSDTMAARLRAPPCGPRQSWVGGELAGYRHTKGGSSGEGLICPVAPFPFS